MKKYLLCLLFLLVLAMSDALYAQYTLTVEITELRNSTGSISFELVDENDKRLDASINKIENNKCVIVVKNLASGTYAFKYFHDENRNNELDKNRVGVPTEGFGFSNNEMGRFGRPKFETTLFEIKDHVKQTCVPNYF